MDRDESLYLLRNIKPTFTFSTRTLVSGWKGRIVWYFSSFIQSFFFFKLNQDGLSSFMEPGTILDCYLNF